MDIIKPIYIVTHPIHHITSICSFLLVHKLKNTCETRLFSIFHICFDSSIAFPFWLSMTIPITLMSPSFSCCPLYIAIGGETCFHQLNFHPFLFSTIPDKKLLDCLMIFWRSSRIQNPFNFQMVITWVTLTRFSWRFKRTKTTENK